MRGKGKEVEQTYQLFEDFLETVILKGKSFLTTGREEISSHAFEECYERYIENAIENSKMSFDQKIQEQFQGTDLGTNLVLAHAIWLWAFAVMDKKKETKKEYIKKQLDGFDKISLIGDKCYPNGLLNAGQWHSQNKYHEIAFTFLIIRWLREQVNTGSLSTVEDVKRRIENVCLFQKYGSEFEEIGSLMGYKKDLPGHSLAIVNILLHLARPEDYENISSDNHKKSIVNAFSGLLDNRIEEDGNINPDIKIKKIRETIAEFGDPGFSFYNRSLKKVWNYSAIQKDFDEIEGLEYKKAIILYGPPGTSKTFAAHQIGKSLITKHFLKNKKNVRPFFESDSDGYLTDRITELQLHPSYTYEDFVAGMQLKDDETVPVQGKLFEICDDAANDEEGLPHVLILDEINRVDLSQLFGEVFSLLENRDKKIPVAYGEGEDFKLEIPDNLYIIGTMNEIDFSLERIDFALRRRFLWYNYGFNPARLESIIEVKEDEYNVDLGEGQKSRFVSNASALNKEISGMTEFGKQYEIGHTFFSEVVDIYNSYKRMNNYTSRISNKIFRDGGPAEILWDISIKPIIESFFGSMNPEEVEKKMESLRKTYLRELN